MQTVFSVVYASPGFKSSLIVAVGVFPILAAHVRTSYTVEISNIQKEQARSSCKFLQDHLSHSLHNGSHPSATVPGVFSVRRKQPSSFVLICTLV